MPLQTPQSRKSELTSMNVNTKFFPSSVTKRPFLGWFINLWSEDCRGPTTVFACGELCEFPLALAMFPRRCNRDGLASSTQWRVKDFLRNNEAVLTEVTYDY